MDHLQCKRCISFHSWPHLILPTKLWKRYYFTNIQMIILKLREIRKSLKTIEVKIQNSVFQPTFLPTRKMSHKIQFWSSCHNIHRCFEMDTGVSRILRSPQKQIFPLKRTFAENLKQPCHQHFLNIYNDNNKEICML